MQRTIAYVGTLISAAVLTASAPDSGPGRPVLLQETFDRNTRGWAENGFGGEKSLCFGPKCSLKPHDMNLVSGRYVIDHRQDGDISAYSTIAAPVGAQGDFGIAVELEKISGTDDFGYGVVFGRQNDQNYHQFLVSGTGRFMLSERFEGKWVGIVPWSASGAVRKGNAKNQFRVERVGERVLLFVNGVLVAVFPFPDPIPPGIGFVAYGRMKIAADDLLVLGPGGVSAPAEEVERKLDGLSRENLKTGARLQGEGALVESMRAFRRAALAGTALADSKRFDHRIVSYATQGLALSLSKLGKFDHALQVYESTLKVLAAAGTDSDRVPVLMEMGALYAKLGDETRAKGVIAEATEMARKTGKVEAAAIGMAHLAALEGRTDRAMNLLSEALVLLKKTGKTGAAASIQLALGSGLLDRGDPDAALASLSEAAEFFRARNDNENAALAYVNMGTAYERKKRLDEALAHYNQALQMYTDRHARPQMASTSVLIGRLVFEKGDFAGSVRYFAYACDLIDGLRRDVEGETRRDYFSKQRLAYEYWVKALIAKGDLTGALEVAEAASAKFLSEKLGERRILTKDAAAKPAEVLARLDTKTAYVHLANVNWSHVDLMVGDRAGLHAGRAVLADVWRDVPANAVTLVRSGAGAAATRGVAIRALSGKETAAERKTLEEFVDAYRVLLATPAPGDAENAARAAMARRLYDWLLGPVEKYIADRDWLIIRAEGALALIPFETLVMPDGRYLVEKYHVTYVHSLSVWDSLSKRERGPAKQAVLVLGGADYRSSGRNVPPVASGAVAHRKMTETLDRLSKSEPVADAYEAFGIGDWPPLAGTLAEAKAIGGLFRSASVVTGARVSEQTIKDMSRRGALKDFGVIHFATHGVAVPELPELSALVLSQPVGTGGAGEDNYLNMREIATLDLRADFVNLSACETGLGRIYDGEGVVGLTQAFLIAGANGLAVSLWQVADESTREFMVGMYSRARAKGMGFDRAMTEMKREFIRHPRYSGTFHWAPFIYYGVTAARG